MDLPFALLVALLLPIFCVGLEVRVDIPPYKERGSNAELKCLYSHEEAPLYSVKWFKGDNHFYQFLPAMREPKSVFSVPNLKVDLLGSNESVVQLLNLSMSASGSYRCEVITEGPYFYQRTGQGNMTVVDLPEGELVLSGLPNSYHLGEEVHVNCSSYSSKPAASLHWYINGVIVNNSNWLIPYPITVEHNELETSVLGLQFIGTRSHFRRGTLRLRCTAQIGNLYYQSYEKVVINTSFMQMMQEAFGLYIPFLF